MNFLKTVLAVIVGFFITLKYCLIRTYRNCFHFCSQGRDFCRGGQCYFGAQLHRACI